MYSSEYISFELNVLLGDKSSAKSSPKQKTLLERK